MMFVILIEIFLKWYIILGGMNFVKFFKSIRDIRGLSLVYDSFFVYFFLN